MRVIMITATIIQCISENNKRRDTEYIEVVQINPLGVSLILSTASLVSRVAKQQRNPGDLSHPLVHSP
jgi:hypothetical protein